MLVFVFGFGIESEESTSFGIQKSHCGDENCFGRSWNQEKGFDTSLKNQNGDLFIQNEMNFFFICDRFASLIKHWTTVCDSLYNERKKISDSYQLIVAVLFDFFSSQCCLRTNINKKKSLVIWLIYKLLFFYLILKGLFIQIQKSVNKVSRLFCINTSQKTVFIVKLLKSKWKMWCTV